MMFQSSLGHSGGVQEDVVLTVGVLVEGELRRAREERKGERGGGGERSRVLAFSATQDKIAGNRQTTQKSLKSRISYRRGSTMK